MGLWWLMQVSLQAGILVSRSCQHSGSLHVTKGHAWTSLGEEPWKNLVGILVIRSCQHSGARVGR